MESLVKPGILGNCLEPEYTPASVMVQSAAGREARSANSCVIAMVLVVSG